MNTGLSAAVEGFLGALGESFQYTTHLPAAAQGHRASHGTVRTVQRGVSGQAPRGPVSAPPALPASRARTHREAPARAVCLHPGAFALADDAPLARPASATSSLTAAAAPSLCISRLGMWAPLLVKSENHKSQTLVTGGKSTPPPRPPTVFAHPEPQLGA